RLLALYHLDRGRYDSAALCFSRLLDRVGADRLPPTTLFASVLAFRQAGHEDRAKQVWNCLAARAADGMRLRGQPIRLPELGKERARLQTAAPQSANHSGQVAGSGLLLEPRWTLPTAREAATREWLQSAFQRQEGRTEPVWPAAIPVAAGDA